MKAIVITRDRVTYARQCVDRLVDAGLDVHIVDHGSTWPEMLNWLGMVAGEDRRDAQRRDNPTGRVYQYSGTDRGARIHVHWMGNDHPRAIWSNGTLASIVHPGERYIVTDCDILPPDEPGWVEHLGALLDLVPDAVKAGCGLITDDLPDHYEHADRVRMWEANYQGFGTLVRDKASGLAYYRASVDTTLAMYRDMGIWSIGGYSFAIDPAVRSADARFMARHLSWYEDSANPTDEQRYYRNNAMAGVSHWSDPDGYVGTYGLEG